MTKQRASGYRKGGQRRPRVVPLWRRRATLAIVAVLVIGIAAAGGWWLWKDGWLSRTQEQFKWRLVAMTADLGFTVQEILVVGRRETPRQDLLDTLRLDRGAPILAFDPEPARQRLEALPWIRMATVERRLPDTVMLRLVERRPMALWQNQGKFALIDHEGEVILRRDLERYADLLVVVGEDAPAHAAELLRVLGTQGSLLARVRAAVRVGGRRWNLLLDNSIDVRLPERDATGALARLAEYQRTHKILERDIQVLDLRLPDRLIVRRSHDTEGRKAVLGKET